MRIVQLSKDYSANGGVGSYLLHLSSSLQAIGHEVFVIHGDPSVSQTPSHISGQFYIKGFYQIGSRCNNKNSISQAIEILGAVNPDIVHVQAHNNFLLEMEIRQRFSTVKTLHVHDFCPSGNKFHHATGKVCQHPTGSLCVVRMGYKRCLLSKRPWVIWSQYRHCVEANRNNAHYTKIIVGSEYMKHQAVASGYPIDRIEVLPYFTGLPEIFTASNNGEKKILYVGRVVREKGLDRLLAAFSLVRIPSRLIVNGDGMDLWRAKKIAHRLGLDDRTEFSGWIDREKLSQYYQKASIVVVPSVWPEPFGLVGIEAMSYGKPVVAFNVGGIPEWLEDGVTGFLIQPYNVKEMAERIDYLLENPDVAREMGMQGRKRVEAEFSKEKHIARLLEIYHEVIDG